MKKSCLTDLIEIDATLATPVYKQIVHSIHRNIENGTLHKDDVLPSVNKIAECFSLARGSVFSAYNDLRACGIIDSIPGKGYYVTGTQTKQKQNIFLLFSTFTPYKETLYNALIQHLPTTSSLDIYFHHHNMKMFETLIKEQAAYYNTFIIMPEINDKTGALLSKLDHKNTFLLDVGFDEYRKIFPGVYQNFKKDIYNTLSNSAALLSKYKRLFLIFPDGVTSTGIIDGFKKFSQKKIIQTEIRNQINAQDIRKNDAFIIIEDNHLVDIINTAKEKKWQLGRDIGILSYNETSLKSVIAEGISTITTDFEAMGKSIAEMAVSGKKEVIENPFIMIDRKSF